MPRRLDSRKAASILWWVLTTAILPSAFAQGPHKLQVYWTDRGINNFGTGLSNGPVIGGVPAANQIPIWMPSDGVMPRTDQQWSAFGQSVYNTLKLKLSGAAQNGTNQVEVRTFQNIATGGYFLDSDRQGQVDRFTEEVGKALMRVKTDLSENANISVVGVAGSNGGRAFSEVIPKLAQAGSNPLESVVFVDSRGEAGKTQQACLALSNGCSIRTTGPNGRPSSCPNCRR